MPTCQDIESNAAAFALLKSSSYNTRSAENWHLLYVLSHKMPYPYMSSRARHSTDYSISADRILNLLGPSFEGLTNVASAVESSPSVKHHYSVLRQATPPLDTLRIRLPESLAVVFIQISEQWKTYQEMYRMWAGTVKQAGRTSDGFTQRGSLCFLSISVKRKPGVVAMVQRMTPGVREEYE
jgi:hypothetical protein